MHYGVLRLHLVAVGPRARAGEGRDSDFTSSLTSPLGGLHRQPGQSWPPIWRGRRAAAASSSLGLPLRDSRGSSRSWPSARRVSSAAQQTGGSSSARSAGQGVRSPGGPRRDGRTSCTSAGPHLMRRDRLSHPRCTAGAASASPASCAPGALSELGYGMVSGRDHACGVLRPQTG